MLTRGEGVTKSKYFADILSGSSQKERKGGGVSSAAGSDILLCGQMSDYPAIDRFRYGLDHCSW